jgi:hypothetical protein
MSETNQDEELVQKINALKPGSRLKAIFEINHIGDFEFIRHESPEEFTGRVKGMFTNAGEPVPEDVFRKFNNEFRRIKRSKIVSVG